MKIWGLPVISNWLSFFSFSLSILTFFIGVIINKKVSNLKGEIAFKKMGADLIKDLEQIVKKMGSLVGENFKIKNNRFKALELLSESEGILRSILNQREVSGTKELFKKVRNTKKNLTTNNFDDVYVDLISQLKFLKSFLDQLNSNLQ